MSEVNVLSIAPSREWTPADQAKLDQLRASQAAGRLLFFVLHAEHPELSMFQLGYPYPITILNHTDICHVKSDHKYWSFNVQTLIEHFSFVQLPEETHCGLLNEMDMEAIVEAAERWQALTSSQVQFPMMAPVGFSALEQMVNPNRRNLTLAMNLVDPQSQMRESDQSAHTDAVYKLTELADIVRARFVENDKEERSA